MDTTITLTIPGNPAPQGSKRYVGHRTSKATGRKAPVLVEQSKRVSPWRETIALHTRQAMAGRAPLDGALSAQILFTVPRPKTRRGPYPSTRATGDLDKLLRALNDGLSDGGAVVDDSRIIAITVRKLYAGSPGALPEPGACVTLSPYSDPVPA